MTLGEPTRASGDRDREWRRGAAKRYAAKQREKKPPTLSFEEREAARQVHEMKANRRARKKPAARNDAQWRKDCIAVYGHTCMVPGCGSRSIEMDHMCPRSQGGESVVENGLPLCGSWSQTYPGGHHQAKTNGLLRFEWAWLTDAQRTYLATIGWVDWDEDGQPFGNGWRHFNPKGA